MHRRKLAIAVTLAGSLSFLGGLMLRQNSEEQAATKAARLLIQTVPPDQLKELRQNFDSEARTIWSFVPGPHPGLSLKKMDTKSRGAALALLKASLSDSGYQKVENIRALEPVLRELEGGNMGRDVELYYFTLFGDPSATGDWMFRYEGHHVSLSFTYKNGKLVSSTPQFLGSNPATVLTGPKQGTKNLAKEEEAGRAFLKSLSESQKKEAIQEGDAPFDIITGNSRKASLDKQVGIPYRKLTQDQKKALRELVVLYADILKPEAKAQRLAKIEKAKWDSITFAWIGSEEPRKKHYYRIHGPTFLIEYDNTQNDANHIHTVWRDFEGDFGRDALAEHYQHGHKHDEAHSHSGDASHTH